MSPTGNVVPFKLIVSNENPTPAFEGDEADRPITELEASIVHLATFLLDNKKHIKSFVCGITCFDINNPDGGDQAFHRIASPIDAAEYALTLQFLNEGFRQRLFPAVVDED
jgi:hypothetical protein